MARDTRERIVATARDLVHSASLAEVSIDDVCRAAGVHKGSLYHFFPSKEALAAAVLERNWTMMTRAIEEAFTPDVPPLARIDRFLDGFAEMLALVRERTGSTPGCPLGGLAGELAGHDAEARAQVTRVFKMWTRCFADAITEAQDRREVDRAVDAAAASVRLLAHLQGLALLAKAFDDPEFVLRAKVDFPLLLAAPR